jgi:hypothetical protein
LLYQFNGLTLIEWFFSGFLLNRLGEQRINYLDRCTHTTFSLAFDHAHSLLSSQLDEGSRVHPILDMPEWPAPRTWTHPRLWDLVPEGSTLKREALRLEPRKKWTYARCFGIHLWMVAAEALRFSTLLANLQADVCVAGAWPGDQRSLASIRLSIYLGALARMVNSVPLTSSRSSRP